MWTLSHTFAAQIAYKMCFDLHPSHKNRQTVYIYTRERERPYRVCSVSAMVLLKHLILIGVRLLARSHSGGWVGAWGASNMVIPHKLCFFGLHPPVTSVRILTNIGTLQGCVQTVVSRFNFFTYFARVGKTWRLYIFSLTMCSNWQ